MSFIFHVIKTVVTLALTLSFLWTVFASPVLSQDFQRMPIVLHAPNVLPRELLTGPNYKVKDVVISDGLINIYELDTLYGPLKVESTALLLKRINELKAINRIDQLKGTEVYGNAFKQAAAGPLKTAEGLVTDPVGTVSGVATGIGHFFSNIERSVTTKDPYQPSAANALLGQAAYKRQFAHEFGVDPYSSYAPLQKALDDLSWTATAGGLTVKPAMMAIPWRGRNRGGHGRHSAEPEGHGEREDARQARRHKPEQALGHGRTGFSGPGLSEERFLRSPGKDAACRSAREHGRRNGPFNLYREGECCPWGVSDTVHPGACPIDGTLPRKRRISRQYH
jgi:hypothetical protein